MFSVLLFGCRTPQGVRGLKLVGGFSLTYFLTSHSARSAWIETVAGFESFRLVIVALRKECVD